MAQGIQIKVSKVADNRPQNKAKVIDMSKGSKPAMP